MKKHIITGIIVVACVALCTAVWPRITGDGKVPVEPIKTAVNANVEASPEETPTVFLSDDSYTPEPKGAVENEPAKTEVNTTEEKTEPTPATLTKTEASTKPSSDPKPGTISVINGERYM